MNWDDLGAWTNQLSEHISTSPALNSNFVTALIGSLAGAGAGAWAGAYIAQRIADRAKSREELLKELRNTNAAINVASGICNIALSLKEHHVRELKTAFDRSKAELIEFKQRRDRDEIPDDVVFNFHADLASIPPVQMPVDILQTLVFEKISNAGRPLRLATTIAGVVHSLNSSINTRNDIAENFRVVQRTHDEFARLFFGLPDRANNVDARYPAAVEAIYQYTNDCIFFSKLLTDDLNEHGKIVRKAYVSKFGRKAPMVAEVNFNIAEERGLMPPAADYESWTQMFASPPTPPTRVARLTKSIRKLYRFSLITGVATWWACKDAAVWIAGKLHTLWRRIVRKIVTTIFRS